MPTAMSRCCCAGWIGLSPRLRAAPDGEAPGSSPRSAGTCPLWVCLGASFERMQRMSAPDAAVYWRSATQRSDIFAVHCFDVPDTPISMDAVVDELRGRARGIGDLCQRVLNVPGTSTGRTGWVRAPTAAGLPCTPSRRQGCLDRLGELDGDQLDPTECAWRIHIFGPLTGAPQGCSARGGEAIVVALQVSHALADGRGNAAICRALFGAVPPQYDACTDSPASGRLRFMRGAGRCWSGASAGVGGGCHLAGFAVVQRVSEGCAARARERRAGSGCVHRDQPAARP